MDVRKLFPRIPLITLSVHLSVHQDGDDDTFVYTGDIHAMWLRDSGAQVWPYVDLANEDPALKKSA